jgi:hypothetical protein
MARKVYYKIFDDGKNKIADSEWEEILRLQHWYNSEFIWTAGRLALKMFAVFPNMDRENMNEEELWQQIMSGRYRLRTQGLSENEIVQRLEAEGLVIVKKGGYFDACLASGFTRVAANEFNAYLVCEFLLKVSHIAQDAVITVLDEGEFIKTRNLKFRKGNVILSFEGQSNIPYVKEIIANRHVFAVVDAAKYDHFPKFKTTISDFNDLTKEEKQSILHDWNWLGFDNNFDLNGDDILGFDLNKKVTSFELENNQT